MHSIYLNNLPESSFPGEADYSIGDSENMPCFINKVNYLNIFVGANNSGKSRLLRGIMQQPKYLVANDDLTQAFAYLLDSLNIIESHVSQYQNLSLYLSYSYDHRPEETVHDLKKHLSKFIDSAEYLYKGKSSVDFINELKNNKRAIEEAYNNVFKNDKYVDGVDRYIVSLLESLGKMYIVMGAMQGDYHANKSYAYAEVAKYAKDVNSFIDIIIKNFLREIEVKKIYIPILRSARSLIVDAGTERGRKEYNLYKDAVCVDYKIDKRVIEVETGLDLYQKIKRTRNQVRKVRQSFEAFEKFLQYNFFQGRDFELVAKESDQLHEEHLSVYIDGDERDLHSVGDGVQALVILLYPVFMALDNSYIFIEEPEINMHPGMQRLFIDTLLTHAEILKKNLKFFITTHSNHLLNTSLESRERLTIFLVKKVKVDEKSCHVVTVSHSRDINILNNIGVLSSSVFLANCSIWIEGVTDRKYLQRYIECYISEKGKGRLQEDLHYTFLEYAGSNLMHYEFDNDEDIDNKSLAKLINGLSISNKIMLVADRDKDKEAKHAQFTEQANNQFTYLVLPALEIENLLTPEVLRASLPEVLQVAKAKSSSVKIESVGYAEKGLGSYLTTQLKQQGIIPPDSFKAKSGTLGTYYKNKLADASVKHITWATMSPEARDIAKQLYDFILENNQDMIV